MVAFVESPLDGEDWRAVEALAIGTQSPPGRITLPLPREWSGAGRIGGKSQFPVRPFLGTYNLNSPESLVSYSFALPCGLVVASIKPAMLSLSFGNS
jgi:hypothetical protein